MDVRVSYTVVYKAPHQKPASHHEVIEVEDTITIRALVELVRKKSLEYCQHHKYELERFSIKDIA
jgi:hypothetical protein